MLQTTFRSLYRLVSAQRLEIAVPLAIFWVMSSFSLVMLWQGSFHQVALPHSFPGYVVKFPTDASPGYFGVIGNWDGQWYRSIAENGYPRTLPIDPDGSVAMNEWAFYPAYPMIVRVIMWLTSLTFTHVAWLLSLLCGGMASVVIFQVARRFMPVSGAAGLLICLFAFPAAPAFQANYTEALALLVVALFIRALMHGKVVLVILIGGFASLVRPISVPLGFLVLAYALRVWLEDSDDRPRRVAWRLVVAAGLVFSTALVWPAIAGLVTGEPNAFVLTQGAWSVNTRAGGLVGGWLGEVVSLSTLGWMALLLTLLITYLVVRPSARSWGFELRLWAPIYVFYLLAVSRPSSSIVRYLALSITPYWPFPEIVIDRARPARIVAFGVWVSLLLGAQHWWVNTLFIVHDPRGVQPFP